MCHRQCAHRGGSGNCACTQNGFCRILIVRRAFPKQAMEMTEYGKHGKPRNRLSTLPTFFGNPCGITTFPQPRLLAYFKMQDQERPNPRPLKHKGLVMEVLGPKCNGCSGTLTSQEGLVSVLGAERMRSHFVVAVAMGPALRAGSYRSWTVRMF